MRIALLGNGKTGSHIPKLHPDTEVFNSKNKPNLISLSKCDVIISFLPGNVFLDYIPIILESRKPLICGSTGFPWPTDINEKLIKEKLTWVRSHNFSLGMNIVKSMIEKLSLSSRLYDEVKFEINETHHTKKLDAPSGTALSFQDWLGEDCEINSQRIGDVVGDHEIKMSSEFETIKIEHKALDRALFAKGAIWAATKVIKKNKDFGLKDFSALVNEHLEI